MESNASFIESEARMVKHGFIQYPDLVGISRAASPHNDTIRYYSYDGTGTMVDIANGATDYPRVATTRTAHDVAIEWKGLAYGWTDRDIGRAMMTGVPLQDEEVRMAFRIAEETKEDVVLNGDAAKGWDSLINKTGTNAVTIVNSGGEWSTATVDEIIEEINSLLTAIYSETNQVRIADTLLLPVAQMTLLSYKRLPDTGDSILDYIQNHNVYTQVTGSPLMIRACASWRALRRRAKTGRWLTSRIWKWCGSTCRRNSSSVSRNVALVCSGSITGIWCWAAWRSWSRTAAATWTVSDDHYYCHRRCRRATQRCQPCVALAEWPRCANGCAVADAPAVQPLLRTPLTNGIDGCVRGARRATWLT